MFRFCVCICQACNNSNLNEQPHPKYNIEFRFDCDCDVRIRIHYFATEKFHQLSQQQALSYKCACLASKFIHQNTQSLNNLTSTSNTQLLTSNVAKKCFCMQDDTVYKKGVNILFSQPQHVIQPSIFNPQVWQFNLHANYYPIVIECVPVHSEFDEHVHVTLAYIDKSQTILSVPLLPTEFHSSDEMNEPSSSLPPGKIYAQ